MTNQKYIPLEFFKDLYSEINLDNAKYNNEYHKSMIVGAYLNDVSPVIAEKYSECFNFDNLCALLDKSISTNDFLSFTAISKKVLEACNTDVFSKNFKRDKSYYYDGYIRSFLSRYHKDDEYTEKAIDILLKLFDDHISDEKVYGLFMGIGYEGYNSRPCLSYEQFKYILSKAPKSFQQTCGSQLCIKERDKQQVLDEFKDILLSNLLKDTHAISEEESIFMLLTKELFEEKFLSGSFMKSITIRYLNNTYSLYDSYKIALAAEGRSRAASTYKPTDIGTIDINDIDDYEVTKTFSSLINISREWPEVKNRKCPLHSSKLVDNILNDIREIIEDVKLADDSVVTFLRKIDATNYGSLFYWIGGLLKGFSNNSVELSDQNFEFLCKLSCISYSKKYASRRFEPLDFRLLFNKVKIKTEKFENLFSDPSLLYNLFDLDSYTSSISESTGYGGHNQAFSRLYEVLSVYIPALLRVNAGDPNKCEHRYSTIVAFNKNLYDASVKKTSDSDSFYSERLTKARVKYLRDVDEAFFRHQNLSEEMINCMTDNKSIMSVISRNSKISCRKKAYAKLVCVNDE